MKLHFSEICKTQISLEKLLIGFVRVEFLAQNPFHVLHLDDLKSML